MLERIRSKNLHTWLGGYAKHVAHSLRPQRVQGPRHLLFALCDHYEPLWNHVSEAEGEARVRTWLEAYPKLGTVYRDADGRGPQHSFFFPGEEYRERFFQHIDAMVRLGCGEVELHLHHDQDTEAALRDKIQSYLQAYAQHGHLARDPDGKLRYGFIHGNWALANGRPDGKHCGVDNELPILFETGCYADFTFPSVPDPSQPNVVNQIYWPTGELSSRRSYEHAERARVGWRYNDRLLMIEGPLCLSTRDSGLKPRLEYGAVTANDPPSLGRLRAWARQNIHVQGRPEWVFVKTYTHGAQEAQAASLLGDGGRTLHSLLTTHFNDGKRWVLHYVTAREMYNIALAAIAGKSGNPADYRDFELPPPPLVASSRR